MALEWLRRNNPVWDEELRNWLFKEGNIVDEHHDDHEEEDEGNNQSNKDLGIGKI